MDQADHLARRDAWRAAGDELAGFVLGDRTGLTRSGLSRMLRRLEQEGHVARSPDRSHAQRVVVTLVPHPERDDAAEELRRVVRVAMSGAAAEAGLDRARELAGAAAIMRILGACLFEAARDAGARLTGHRRRRARPSVIDGHRA